MADGLHPAAPHHLPFFVPGPEGADPLMIATVVLMLVGTIALGVFFLWAHSLPERMAHNSQKVQMQVVAVLCLLALFTHIHLFWVIALLLALIDFPAFASPFTRMAGSLERMADRPGPELPAATEADAPAPVPAERT